MDTEQIREDFEAKMREAFPNQSLERPFLFDNDLRQPELRSYGSNSVQMMWTGWLAAAYFYSKETA